MDKLKKDWFERFQINFHQAPEGFLAIHAWKKGVDCKYFEVPLEWMDSDDFWEKVHKTALKKWKHRNPMEGQSCPVCKRAFNQFHLRYKGKTFCRWCGSHYVDVGGEIIITRRIDAD